MRYKGGGPCHEVAKQNSPGLALGVGQRRNRPEGATEFCGFLGMAVF